MIALRRMLIEDLRLLSQWMVDEGWLRGVHHHSIRFALMRPKHHVCVSAIHGGALVGGIVFTSNLDDCTTVELLAVRQDMRRLGIATRLFEIAMRSAAYQGVSLTSDCFENTPGHQFLKAMMLHEWDLGDDPGDSVFPSKWLYFSTEPLEEEEERS